MSIENYRGKISGPMLDRIDIHIHLPRVDFKTLQRKAPNSEASEKIKKRVSHVRAFQLQRQGKLNCYLSSNDLEVWCGLTDDLLVFLELVCGKLNMSARAYHRVLKLARTIADMSNDENINKAHLSEAIGYRSMDRR